MSIRLGKKTPVATDEGKIEIGETWKDIIFLPFNRLVNCTFMAVTYLSVMYNIFILTYQPKRVPFNVYLIMDYILEIIYFICVVLLVLHRLMRVHRQRMIYKACPLYLLVVDVISVMPLQRFYLTINKYTWQQQFTDYQTTYNECCLKYLRIVRLIYFYFDLRSNLTYNQTVIIVVCHLLGSFSVIFGLGSIYRYSALHPPTTQSDTWMQHWISNDTLFDKKSDLNWFIVCTYEIAGLYFNNSLRALKYTNINDYIIVFISMMLGFLSQYTFLLGALTSEELQGMRPKYNLQLRLTAAQRLMSTLAMPLHLQNTVHAYYETIWNYRFGVVTMPNMVYNLPPFMQSEILTDIYWEALLHTKIFNNLSSVFRKVVAEQMKTEIYMKDHLVFRENDIKAKLVYLQSGMLEIYTMEAEDSRITLSSGSILCELSCIRPSKCTANIKCLTNCTLHVLYMVDLYNALLKNYSQEFKTMHTTYNIRLKYGWKKLRLVHKRKLQMSHMRWVKTQWRNIRENNDPVFEQNFTTRFLNLITIIDLEHKVDPNAFCLRGQCPFVMVAYTPLDFFFYYFALSATLINFFITYKDILFDGELNLEDYKYYALLDTIFVFDIYIQSITTIKNFNQIIDQPYEIFAYKMKNLCFVLDVLASLPVDYIALAAGASMYTLSLLRLNRYIRLYKLIVSFKYHEKRVTSYSGILQYFKFVVYHLFLSLFIAGIVYKCNCLYNICQPDGFLELVKLEHLRLIGTKINISNLFICLYYSVNIYLKLLLRVYEQIYIPDIILKVLIVILSYYMQSYNLAQICATVGLKYESGHLLQEYVERVDIYVHENKKLKQYKHLILECLSAEFSVSSDLRFQDLCRVTHQESEFLQRGVNDEYILWTLEQTPFFQKFPRDLLMHLAHRAQVFLIPEGHELVKFDRRCFHLYIVVQGFCKGRSYTAGDYEKGMDTYFKRLDMFPLIEFLHQVNSLMAVQSYTAVQVITIPYFTFQSCISVYNRELMILNKALEVHMELCYGLLKWANVKSYINKAVVEVKSNKPVMFHYKIKPQMLILDINNNSQQQSHDTHFAKYRRMLKIISLNTYLANSNYYIAYELFRSICIIIQVNLTLLLCVSQVYNNTLTECATFVFYTMWILDLWVQAHLNYYNDYGIMVNGLKATTKHFIKHTFAIGFLAGLPYPLFKLSAFVRPNRRLAIDLIILINGRMLFLFRPFKLSSYLQNNCVMMYQKVLKNVSMLLMVYFSILYLSAMKLLLTCDIDAERKYVCATNSWIMMRTMYVKWDESKFFWITLRSVLVSCANVADSVSTGFDHTITLIIGIMILCVRTSLIGKIIGANCIGETSLVEHQDDIQRYHKFFSNRMLSNSTKNAMMRHYKNIWQKSYSDKADKIFANIYPHLRETLLLTMYKAAVSKCVLFQEQPVLFNLFMPYIEERYYTKGIFIISTNDVQGNIFIVVKGCVEITTANTPLAHLGAGGLFGCFEPLGLNRHTMAAKTIQDTNVLVMKATRFYQLIKGFHKTETIMKKLRYTQFQYAATNTSSDDVQSTAMSDMTRLSVNVFKYRKLYKVLLYITNMHVAPLSTYAVLIDCCIEFGVMTLLPLWIILDLYFGVVIIFRARVPKIDQKTGLQLNTEKSLQVDYFKSFIFVIDVLTILPIYLVRIWIHQDYHQICFLANKLGRLYFLYSHYKGYVIAKNIPRHVQWTILIYSTMSLAQIIFIIWWFILDLPVEEKIHTNYLITGYITMMNYVSTCGLLILSEYEPSYVVQLSIDMLLVTLSTGLTITLATLFTKSVISNNTFECVYRYAARFSKQFCKVSNVSDALVVRTWQYLHCLYMKQGGQQFPKLYKYAPKFLKQEHMQSLFGKHFIDHPLFYDLHVDLLKQIHTYIKCNYLMPGSLILEKGSKNGEFYIIETGSVLAILADGDDDPNPYFERLGPGKAFGEVQAFLKMEHQKTYKALTSVDLISIKIRDWEYLLEWFPASKEKLLRRINEAAELLIHK